MTLDIERIITYIDKLNELDTSKVKPTDHVITINNFFREDILPSIVHKLKNKMNSILYTINILYIISN